MNIQERRKKNGKITSDRQCDYVRPLSFGLLDGEEAQAAADTLVDAALQAGGSDNISVLVVDMHTENPPDTGWHAGRIGDNENIDDALDGTLHTLRAVP